jgi:Ca-activated chloride channel family protein
MVRASAMRFSIPLVLAASATLLAAPDQPTFRAGVDLVTFGVTVADRRGSLLTDLTRADFQVLEDGKAQTITHFTRGLGDNEGPAAHLGLMLDTSGSMERDLKLARSAAIRFLNLLPEAEDITLVDFDTEVRITRYPQRDFARLVERIRLRKPDGWTALYDALGVYLDGASRQNGRTILVMYTDGADSRSQLRFGDVMDLLKASHVTVYAVGLVERTGRLRTEVTMRLQQMVDATGGQAFFPSSLDDLDESYQRVLDEISAQYQLGYTSSNAALDGRWREVEIKVSRPDVKLRSRNGYFAPYREPAEDAAAEPPPGT